jgi:hypothetical protein
MDTTSSLDSCTRVCDSLLSSDSALKRVLRVYKLTSKDQGSLSWSSSIRYQVLFYLPSSLPFFISLFLFCFLFQLFSLIINLVEVLSRPFHSKGT